MCGRFSAARTPRRPCSCRCGHRRSPRGSRWSSAGPSPGALLGPTPAVCRCRARSSPRRHRAVGRPLARVLARTGFPGLRLLRALVTLPLVLPPVVGGVALLLAFGRNGFVGRYRDQGFGITIPFSSTAVVLAETFVAMPFLIVTVEGALRS